MTWVFEKGFQRRPIVVIEDHLNHLSDICEWLQAEDPNLLRLVTLVGLDQGGPDSRRSVRDWLQEYPAIQVAAHLAEEDAPERTRRYPDRLLYIASDLLSSASPVELSELIPSLVRPGGFLLQDVQLETLHFIPADRRWESIRRLTAVVRGMVPGRPPVCWFMSNKRNPFRRLRNALKDLNFEPRHFLDKDDLEKYVVPTIQGFLEDSMPFSLRVTQHGELICDTVVGEEDLDDVMSGTDLTLWQAGDALRLGGRLIKGGVLKRDFDGAEGTAWRELVADRFAQGGGVKTRRFGELRSPDAPAGMPREDDAIREWAYGLVYNMRSVVQGANPKSVLKNKNKTYYLADRLRVGWVTPNAPFL